MKKAILAILAGVLMPCISSAATYSTTITGLAADSSWILDTQQLGINSLSAQASYSSSTIASQTFTDGASAAGSITISSLTGLSAASATDTIVVTTTTGLTGASISVPGLVVTQGVDWTIGASTTATAASIAAALNRSAYVTATSSYGTITLTAVSAGAWGNTITVQSNNTAITVGSASMTGGYDNATVTVNGVPLKVGKDWTLGSTTTTAATSLAAAISAVTRLSSYLTITPSSNMVSLAAQATGSKYNFSLASTSSNIALSGATMTGGADMAYSVGSGSITIPSHGFTTGLALLYTQAAGKPISPLVDQTTYYAIPVSANTIELATNTANAVAGTYITITSSNTPSHTYTLAPLAISGSGGLKWQVSNDGVTYTDMSASSVTFSTPYTAATQTWDFGDVDYRYIKLAETAPTTGGINIAVTVNGYGPSDFLRKSGGQMTGSLLMSNAPVVFSGTSGKVVYGDSTSNATAGFNTFVEVSSTCAAGTCTATCTSGYTLVSAGCAGASIYQVSVPNMSAGTLQCSGTGSAWVICGKGE